MKALECAHFMKSNGFTTILNIVLGVCLVACVFLCIQSVFLSRDARVMNAQLNGGNAWRNAVNQLAVDCAEYSKKNPEILPILQSIGYNAKPAAK